MCIVQFYYSISLDNSQMDNFGLIFNIPKRLKVIVIND